MPDLHTPRLELWSITLPFVEAALAGDRATCAAIAGAPLPEAWQAPQVVAHAFHPSLDVIRADPAKRLWGDTLVFSRDAARRVVGSVIFHGRPDDDGIAEVGYAIADADQRQGYATEAVGACVAWALAQPGCRAVAATTFPWHAASIRVLQKCGMQQVASRDHPYFGELWIFRRDRPAESDGATPCG